MYHSYLGNLGANDHHWSHSGTGKFPLSFRECLGIISSQYYPAARGDVNGVGKGPTAE